MPKEFYADLWQTIKDKKHVFEGEVRNKRKNGEEYVSKMSIAPVLNENKEVVYFVAIERDITQEKAIAQSKSDFVSIASHQLKTPLTGIQWLVEILQDEDFGTLNKKQRELIVDLQKNAKRMGDIINSLLNVSRIESGMIAVNPEKIDLREIILDVLDELRIKIKHSGVKIKRLSKAPKEARVDIKLLRIVLQNIIANAVKYSAKDGIITIRFEGQENDTVIVVEDQGIGIPKNEQSRVFEKMYRASNSINAKIDGTGLGLYISRTIMRAAGGDVWFKSKNKKGSIFYVSIPKAGMKEKIGTKELIVV